MTHELPHTPSVERKEFNCPHCKAHSAQTWFNLGAEKSEYTPNLFKHMLNNKEIEISKEVKEYLEETARKMSIGKVFFDHKHKQYKSYRPIENIFLSQCYTCKEISVWIYDKLIFPKLSNSIKPNKDLPEDIKRDFEEAAQIYETSPRGASALLRLAIQKLCKHIGCKKEDKLDKDIAFLVKEKGLDIKIQKSLDIVRVIGNNAVHPGELDIKDNKDIARNLFKLVNLIAEKLITEPKEIDDIFESLPKGAITSIERRDSKS